jgi:hypothetical protein
MRTFCILIFGVLFVFNLALTQINIIQTPCTQSDVIISRLDKLLSSTDSNTKKLVIVKDFGIINDFISNMSSKDTKQQINGLLDKGNTTFVGYESGSFLGDFIYSDQQYQIKADSICVHRLGVNYSEAYGKGKITLNLIKEIYCSVVSDTLTFNTIKLLLDGNGILNKESLANLKYEFEIDEIIYITDSWTDFISNEYVIQVIVAQNILNPFGTKYKVNKIKGNKRLIDNQEITSEYLPKKVHLNIDYIINREIFKANVKFIYVKNLNNCW